MGTLVFVMHGRTHRKPVGVASHAPADPGGVLAFGRRRYPDLDVARGQLPHLVQEAVAKAWLVAETIDEGYVHGPGQVTIEGYARVSCALRSVPGNMVEPPARTICWKKVLRRSRSAFMMLRTRHSCTPVCLVRY